MRKGFIAVTTSMLLGIGILSYNLIETKEDVDLISVKNESLSTKLEEKEDIIKDYQVDLDKLQSDVDELTDKEESLKKEVKDYKKKLQDEKYKYEALKKKNNQVATTSTSTSKTKSSTVSASSQDFTMTYYTATCMGCSGYTANGDNVKNTIYVNGYRVLSVDTSIIPLGSIVEISSGTNTFKAQALDTGSAIKGHKLDLLVSSYSEAVSLGKDKVSVKIIRKGW